MELSMADKVEMLGMDVKQFKEDVFALDDKIVKHCTLPLNFKENLEKYIYPELRKLKEKYSMNIPIGLVGLDMVRLEKILDGELLNRGIEV